MFLINIRLKKMCDNAILENVDPDCYKSQQICDKAVDNYCNALKFVPEFYKTHKMCDRAIDKCQFMFDSFLDIFNTQEMCYSR